MPISEFIKKSDYILLEVILPIVQNLQQKGLIKRWYSSRSGPSRKIPYWRARLYYEVAEKKKEEAFSIIDHNTNNIEVIDEFTPSDENSNFEVIQKSSEIALELLLKTQDIDRVSEEFLKEIDEVIINHKIIQTSEGIHWLENNLGYKTNFLGRRYLQKGILHKLW